jgi:hypothetical protein
MLNSSMVKKLQVGICMAIQDPKVPRGAWTQTSRGSFSRGLVWGIALSALLWLGILLLVA